MNSERDFLMAHFKAPKAQTIKSAITTITKNFSMSILPLVKPTSKQVREALVMLGMLDDVRCAYCGDKYTEWDHLRPIVLDQRPTGYISEIHNLVPSCGPCNQSKGGSPWKVWMNGPAAKSPRSRGIPDLERRVALLEKYEAWKPPTKLDLESIVGTELWSDYWAMRDEIRTQLDNATAEAKHMRDLIAAAFLEIQSGR